MQVRFVISFVTLCLLVFIANKNVKGQSSLTFVISNDGGLLDTQPYVNALQSANLELYRQATKRTTMKFDTGVEVELLSGKEVLAQGGNVNLEQIAKNDPASISTSVFELHSSGIILERKDLNDFKPKR